MLLLLLLLLLFISFRLSLPSLFMFVSTPRNQFQSVWTILDIHAILTDYAHSVLLLSQLFFAVFSQCVRVCITNTIQNRYNIFAVCNAKRRHCFTHRSICRASVYSTVHITHFTSSYVQFYVDGLFIRIHTHTHIACILHMSLAFSIESYLSLLFFYVLFFSLFRFLFVPFR